jgi:uncharacterized membrane-anchored protein
MRMLEEYSKKHSSPRLSGTTFELRQIRKMDRLKKTISLIPQYWQAVEK